MTGTGPGDLTGPQSKTQGAGKDTEERPGCQKICADRPKQNQGKAERLEEPRNSERRRNLRLHRKAARHAKARNQLNRGSGGGKIRREKPENRRQESDTECTIPV